MTTTAHTEASSECDCRPPCCAACSPFINHPIIGASRDTRSGGFPLWPLAILFVVWALALTATPGA